MSKRIVNLLLLLAVVALVAVSLVIGARNTGGAEGEKFGGTDSAATDLVTESGHEPWFQPLFQPGSGEVESGLFAVQAALGAGLLGYCLGRLHGRGRRDACATVPGSAPQDLPLPARPDDRTGAPPAARSPSP